MTDKHKALLKQHESAVKEAKDYLAANGDTWTDANAGEYERLKGSVVQLRGQIEQQVAVAKHQQDIEDSTRFTSEVAPGQHIHRGVTAEGATPAGETVFRKLDEKGAKFRRGERKALQIIKEVGPGIVGKSAFDAVSTTEYRESFNWWFRRGSHTNRANFRLLEEGLDPQGGYLAPVEIIARLIERKPTPTRVSGLCDVVNTARDAISLPRVNYTGATDDPLATIYSTGIRATLTDENPTSSTQSNITDTNLFGSVRVQVFTWMLQAPLTLNVIEDATFDPMTWLTGKFAETVELLKDNMAINGSGAGQPVGMLANPQATPTAANTGDSQTWIWYIASGAASAPFITPDSVLAATEQIPEQYDENVRYLYKKTSTGQTIRLFKDGQGRYLFGQGYQDSGIVPGRQKRLNDYPVIWSQFMPDPAANAFPIIAGDFGGATIVNRIGFSVQILREVAAQKNQVIVLGRVRFGFQVIEPWRLRCVKCSVS